MDREDIYQLATALDDVMDAIEAVADLFVLHRIESPLPEMKAQIDVLVLAAAQTEQALAALPKMQREQSRALLDRDQPPGERGRPTVPAGYRRPVLGRAPRDGCPQVEGSHRESRGGSRRSRERREHHRVHGAEAHLAPHDAQPSSSSSRSLSRFDFFNGFHDAANSIATVVSTRVLSPRQAVAWAAFFNFAAFLVFGTAVAATIAKDVVDPSVFDNRVIFAGLMGAIAWDVITWLAGLPTSSSHALVGGMSGAAVASAGWGALIGSGLQKIVVFIVLSPLIGLLLGFTIMVSVYWLFHRRERVDSLHRGFRRMQLVSAAAFSLGHGANDAQKTMGVILALLIANGLLPSDSGVPALGGTRLAHRDRPRHPLRRVEDRSHHGVEDHQDHARQVG